MVTSLLLLPSDEEEAQLDMALLPSIMSERLCVSFRRASTKINHTSIFRLFSIGIIEQGYHKRANISSSNYIHTKDVFDFVEIYSIHCYEHALKVLCTKRPKRKFIHL